LEWVVRTELGILPPRSNVCKKGEELQEARFLEAYREAIKGFR
jgi:hypothetical protein